MSEKSGKNLKTKNNLKLLLVGANGRMGQEILSLAAEAGIAIGATVDRIQDWKSVKADQISVAVDFSSPEGMKQCLKWCESEQKPMVSGTTGISAADLKALQASAKKIPLLYSANMSLGIAVLSAMLPTLKSLSGWDFQIEEAHHSQKKDKPSGTALLLQDRLEKELGRKLPTPNSIRGGSIAGIHEIWAMGPDEMITICHSAFHRRIFARGALQAARWLFDKKPPGFYDLTDLYRTSSRS